MLIYVHVRAGPAASSGSTPLYLGAVRTVRPPPQYSAILAYRPDRPGRGVDALLALSNTGKTGGGGGAAAAAGDAAAFFTLPGASMLFCFMAEGRMMALTGHDVSDSTAVNHAYVTSITSKQKGAFSNTEEHAIDVKQMNTSLC